MTTATTATTATIATTKITDLTAYCENCSARQSENYHKFSTNYAARSKADWQIKEEMKNDLAIYFGFSYFSDVVKTKLFDKAWEDGHSGGYMEVAMEYQEMLEIAYVVQNN